MRVIPSWRLALSSMSLTTAYNDTNTRTLHSILFRAWELKTPIYLASAAAAETIADIFLCPLEAVRIRSVSDPDFCDGLADGFGKMLKSEGIGGFYAGIGPILFKQVRARACVHVEP